MSNEYSMLLHESGVRTPDITGSSAAIAAARISYYLNLRGPAIPIDTACSSSLVATHLACQALQAGETDMALAGGVTLYLTPGSYVSMCGAGMLSPEGRCKAFDDSADGFIPGEGAGCLVLKRLRDAEADNDSIYGVIIGSGINQDGRTNGITAPSVRSQTDLERGIYEKYKIDPGTVSYIETHGTGTRLGDPMELEALATVFREKTDKKNYCALGSVKTNIGHTSAAAGVAGVHKVLLCMQNRMLVPSLNFETPNKHFNFEDSPFYVNTGTKTWESAPGVPRRACVSSFGYSGTNAHVVIEEYARNHRGTKMPGPFIFVLSAKNRERLKAYAAEMEKFLNAESDIADVAYTSQVGREPMDERLALVASSAEDLGEKLKSFADGKENIQELYCGSVRQNKDALAVFKADEEFSETVGKWISRGKYSKLLDLWVRGLVFDWNRLYGDEKPRRISLPTYPFARERCWIPENAEGRRQEAGGRSQEAEGGRSMAVLHPLVHRNTSDFSEQRFSSVFTGEEFFLADHVIRGERVLPGVAHLEMARAAVQKAAGLPKDGHTGIRLRNMVWARPVAVGENPVQLHIGLFPGESGEIACEIYSRPGDPDAEPVMHSQGTVLLTPGSEVPILDIEALKSECDQRILLSEEFYETFMDMGTDCGPGHRGIEKIYAGPGQVLAKLSLPSSISDTQDQFVLHPCLADSALQAAGLIMQAPDAGTAAGLGPALPFALEDLEIFEKCSEKMWALVRQTDPGQNRLKKFDISLCNQTGQICVSIRGLKCDTELPFSPGDQQTGTSLSPVTLPDTKSFPGGETPGKPANLRLNNDLTPGIVSKPAKPVLTDFSPDGGKPSEISLKTSAFFIEYPTVSQEVSKPREAVVQEHAEPVSSDPQAPVSDKSLEKELITSLADVLFIKPGDVDVNKRLADMGLDSIIGVEWISRINKDYGTSLVAPVVYDYPTLKEFSEMLGKKLARNKHLTRTSSKQSPGPGISPSADSQESPGKLISHRQPFARVSRSGKQRFPGHGLKTGYSNELKEPGEPVAIIGMSGRYPDAPDLARYWANLAEAKDSVREIPGSRWDVKKYYDPRPSVKNKVYCKNIGILDDTDLFDPLFFMISPAEAELMDPQHRIFLQEGYRAFEDAGYASSLLNEKKCGVYLGIMINEYGMLLYENRAGAGDATGNSASIAAARISYHLNLKGPAIPIDTACSSSLVATHLACQALRTGETDMALAGGVTLYLTPGSYVSMCGAGMLSPGGRCKTFDNSADGFVPGEGAGCLVLKRLKDAEADNDSIYGVIIGSGINQDGKTNGITAPSARSQADLERGIYDRYKIDPGTVSYIETHGTGTKLGDPIELEALATVFREKTDKKNYCALGSVKTNIGHTSAAAGVAGVHKVLLCMQNRMLVPSLNFETPNEHFSFEDSPFYVNTETKTWESAPGVPRRACVSSFGYSGTNAHVVIEEYAKQGTEPQGHGSTEADEPQIFVLSARTEDRLRAYAKNMAEFLEKTGSSRSVTKTNDLNISDIAYTSQVGREPMEERLAVTAGSARELREKLGSFADGKENMENFYRDRVRPHKETLAVFEADEDMAKISDAWIAGGKHAKLLSLWVRGLNFDWNRLHKDEKPRRISLPAYPFARERYWIPAEEGTRQDDLRPAGERAHPQAGEAAENSPGDVFRGHDRLSEYEHPRGGSSLAHKHAAGETGETAVSDWLTAYIRNALAAITKVRPEDLETDEDFEMYGLDSVMIVRLSNELELQFGKLPTTLFFTYKNIGSLARYFLENHGDKIRMLFQDTGIGAGVIPGENAGPDEMPRSEKITGPVVKKLSPGKAPGDSIAVIGMSGRYPMADTADEFWDNLKSGRDCVTEIPGDRWDYRKYPGMYCRWGGFLKDIDAFDPLFFNISPNTARFADPQERLFLQAAWSCTEDAGYTRKRLEDPHAGDRRGNVGVFAGVSFNEYQLYSAAEWEKGNAVPVNSQICSVANRVSYVLNLRGPSLSVDTACSSSLYALHLACESMLRDECGMAIAGGVSLSVHPAKYISLCAGKFAAGDGRCRSFGQGGDGYVPGEGVGAVLLKPLGQAVKDQDHIYAVIKGTAVNHDGKTQGYSVPNPVAQTEVIRAALEKSGVSPRTVSFVEAHGTGTALGDPIEIAGLTDAYETYTRERQYCAIGSAKSNIGHLEAAAGISQLTKVILQMRHKTLVPSLLHSESLNPNIDFENSPFFVQQEAGEWKQPVIRENGTEQVFPRRAGISSFGFSGVNAHAIIEEYQEPPCKFPGRPGDHAGPVLIPLSAKTVESLKTYADHLKTFLEKSRARNSMPATGDIAYTLQTGREQMSHRAAFAVRTAEELTKKLDLFSKSPGNRPADGIFSGQNPGTGRISGGEENTRERDSSETADRWVRGTDYDWDHEWEMLHTEHRPRRISLPTYPFLRERYWITGSPAQAGDFMSLPDPGPGEKKDPAGKQILSPFLSDLAEAPGNEQQVMITEFLREKLGSLLGFAPPALPAPDQGFFEMGMESVQAVQFQSEIEEDLMVKISDTAVFDYPNTREFSDYLLTLISFEEAEAAGAAATPEPPDGNTYDAPDSDPLPGDIRNMSVAEASEILESEIGYLIQGARSLSKTGFLRIADKAEKILEAEF